MSIWRRPIALLRAVVPLGAALASCTLARYEVAQNEHDRGEPADVEGEEVGEEAVVEGEADRPDMFQWPDVVCADGASACFGECVDLSSDPEHCGACGVACGDHGRCVDGVCVCDSGYTWCPGGCARLDNDRENCGECGRACAEGQNCRRGECA